MPPFVSHALSSPCEWCLRLIYQTSGMRQIMLRFPLPPISTSFVLEYDASFSSVNVCTVAKWHEICIIFPHENTSAR